MKLTDELISKMAFIEAVPGAAILMIEGQSVEVSFLRRDFPLLFDLFSAAPSMYLASKLVSLQLQQLSLLLERVKPTGLDNESDTAYGELLKAMEKLSSTLDDSRRIALNGVMQTLREKAADDAVKIFRDGVDKR